MNEKNTFVSMAEQVALLNKNSVEMLTKLTEAISTNSSSVSIKYISENGVESKYAVPSVTYLNEQITIANNNIKRLTQFNEKATYIIDGQATNKLLRVDLNREPEQIGDVEKALEFTPVNNWFFESLMSPLLTVSINLTDLVDDDVTKVLSRRYILQFAKNADGTYTQNGRASLDDFNSKFANRNNINISEFLEWFDNPTNVGVLGSDVTGYDPYDEQIFTMDYSQLSDYGLFSVLKQELDTINKKLFYHVNTLTYYDINGVSKTLKIGDELILNKKNSTTRYLIKEVNTSASNYRLVLERIEGYDPVIVGTNTLKYYSTVKQSKIIKVTVGFNEINVIFLKAINGSNNIISSLWSRGVSFFTNDLKLNTNPNVKLSSYYLDQVYDYGTLLKDMVKKQIPSSVGVIPNAPNLVDDNFKIVQINKHITDSNDTKKVRELHSQKNTTKTQIDQISDAISLKTKELQRKQFKTIAERSKAENELSKLNAQLENSSKMLNSITKQITSSNIDTSVEPKFRLRGFFDFPAPQKVEGYRDQEVVQFIIQYRYSSKSGNENTTEGYKLVSTTDVAEQTGYISNWVQVVTDARKRYYDETTQTWQWKIEDVSDADTPNINQLDIAIQKGEKVDIRVKSISEVGWPDAKLESEWSAILTKEFPDELNSVLNSNDFILKEASEDGLKLQFEDTLNAKGYVQHIAESFSVNQEYFAHTDKTIQTSFVDANSNSLSLYAYLKTLTDKINSLEEIVRRSKGELQVLVFNNTDEYKVANGAEVNFTVDCEGYAELAGTTAREYKNKIYIIGDYYIRIDNVATENSLGLLSDRLFKISGTTATNTFFATTDLAAMVDNNNKLRTQFDNQFIWFSDKSGSDKIYDKTGVANTAGVPCSPSALSNDYYNVGLDLPDIYSNNDPVNLISDVRWDFGSEKRFFSTIHPVIKSSTDIVETGQEKTKYIEPSGSIVIPINIYFKLVGTSALTVNMSDNSYTDSPTKKVKVFLETTNSTRPFEFTINFRLNQSRIHS